MARWQAVFGLLAVAVGCASRAPIGPDAGNADARADVATRDGTADIATPDTIADVATTNGSADLRTTDGSADLAATDGSADLATTDGSVDLATTDGSADLATTDGSADVATTDGSADVATRDAPGEDRGSIDAPAEGTAADSGATFECGFAGLTTHCLVTLEFCVYEALDGTETTPVCLPFPSGCRSCACLASAAAARVPVCATSGINCDMPLPTFSDGSIADPDRASLLCWFP